MYKYLVVLLVLFTVFVMYVGYSFKSYSEKQLAIEASYLTNFELEEVSTPGQR